MVVVKVLRLNWSLLLRRNDKTGTLYDLWFDYLSARHLRNCKTIYVLITYHTFLH